MFTSRYVKMFMFSFYQSLINELRLSFFGDFVRRQAAFHFALSLSVNWQRSMSASVG
jgi:hypothetical protein